MHLDDRVPIVLGHVERHLVPEDAGVVHQHVEGPVGVDSLLDEALGARPAGDVVVVGDRGAAGRLHLVDHLLGRTVVLALAGPVATEVVDDHAGARPSWSPGWREWNTDALSAGPMSAGLHLAGSPGVSMPSPSVHGT